MRRTTFAVVVDALEGRGDADAGREGPRLPVPRADPDVREDADGRAADPRRGGRAAGPVLRLVAIGCSPGVLGLRPGRR
ncbi:hypothetical protein [Phycicoccus avicenniae]|uniref:hypothetical protein n=1 Tax=Phycicoccus avicenniae TaxID=2828860 RepID=UPI003D2693DD